MRHTLIDSPESYSKHVHNVLIFKHLRAYNRRCSIWKKEDHKFIENLDKSQEWRDANQDLVKESLEVYKRAKEEYAELAGYLSAFYSGLKIHEILEEFGFDPIENDEDVDYVLQYLDVDINSLKKNKNYPKEFPFVLIEFLDSEGMYFVAHKVYKSDFFGSTKAEDFSWLEKNAREFWS